MKKIILINVLFVTATIYSMHTGNYPSKPLQVPGRIFDHRPLTTSKSPGDWDHALASLDARSQQELEEARAYGHNEAKKDALAIEITSFIANESIILIKRIITQKFNSTISMGDAKIDTCIKELLKDENNQTREDSGQHLAFDATQERFSTYKIRTDPKMSSKIDRHALKLALLVNRALRLAESK
jgi:hypothetical protein